MGRAVKRAALLPFVGVCISLQTRFSFTVELLPLFAEMFGRFCLNRARQSDHENRGRHFRLGADDHRIRDLFGCSVDERRGLSHSCPGACDGGCRTCAQTRLGAKVAGEGLVHFPFALSGGGGKGPVPKGVKACASQTVDHDRHSGRNIIVVFEKYRVSATRRRG